MQGREQPWRNHGNRVAFVPKRGRSRLLTIVTLGACSLASLGPARISAAQSPFAQPPSPSGTFTLPLPAHAQSPFTQPPGRGGTVTLPSPAPLPRREGVAPRAGALPGMPESPPSPLPLRPGTAPGTGALPQPLPLLNPEEGTAPETAALPPKPAVLPPLSATPTAPIPRVAPLVLRTGLAVTLRICQVLPADGFSPGERLLNSRPAIQPGDCFLAEVIDPCPPYPILVGGTVTKITEPGRFGRPGYVSLQMTQLVQTEAGQPGWVPWRMDLADRRFATRMRRVLLSTLLGLEGAGTGASIGAQFSGGNMAFIGGGMGIGAIVGLGYASFQRGTEANLEPGDTFEIVVGSTHSRPIPREWQTILYPASDPIRRKSKKP